MGVGLSTAHLLTPTASVARILEALAAAAPAAVELAAGGPAPLPEALLTALSRRRPALPLLALEAYAPGGRASAGPALCALDRDERAAAVRLAQRSLQAAAGAGIGVLVVALGRVAVDAAWPSSRCCARPSVTP